MEVVILEDAHQVAVAGAEAIAQHVIDTPTSVIGLATGSSPLGVYRELAARVQAGSLSFAGCTAFLLDEYVGLGPGHPQAYRTVIDREFTDHVDIDGAHVCGLDGLAEDIPTMCEAYEEAIAQAGGIDVQLLGVGTDGHIAFNEPGSSFASRTRIKNLTGQTRRDNARFFDGDLTAVPQHCLTQGIGTILEARHLVLVALGVGKAEAVRELIEGPVSALWPATALQLHRHVTVIIDEAAASDLKLADYYRECYASKPAWQRF
ncbi:MAG: glucosamine-6-phosphate deaminase [Ornithinimicrobium sp.]|uniref:glucosamine-6-phosphate deaminase n=1 Tax=Ornithinimicrobium sp. TaxID=1977084 RepID=UPI0026E099EB|nr:glucosamine-6-phosphate deaminase [Ornithinimicrobium sp.]MDO5739956.1 glucosamine-6-phosphate deaminase [Ornithinimicrobium sp.]